MTKAASTVPGERIAKVMARAGLCSRREAEAWIAAGRVSVNGEKIASPALNVTPEDTVTIDGKPLPKAERTRLFLYHKPRGLVTTHADPEKRPTIFEKLPKGLPRLVSVGRLDLNTEGLLLLTNDGGLARVLELPQTGWLRRYRVRAHGSVTQPQLDALRKGVTVNGVRYGEIEASLDRTKGANAWLTFAIREGKNREVRNVIEYLGLKVNRLIRVSFGPFQLGDLAEGDVEEIRTRHLREQLGERIAAQAGADFSGPMVAVPLALEQTRESEPRTKSPHRHPEERAQRASKGDGPRRGRHPSGAASPPPQDDGVGKKPRRGKAPRKPAPRPLSLGKPRTRNAEGRPDNTRGKRFEKRRGARKDARQRDR